MLTLALAQQLREAGLVWRPVPFDVFSLPDRQMDDDVFVISDQAAFLQLYNGYPVVAFHGSAEWALDHVYLTEVTWLPSESQLRQQIERRIPNDAPLRLERTAGGYCCETVVAGTAHVAEAADAETALAEALLALLRADDRPIDDR